MKPFVADPQPYLFFIEQFIMYVTIVQIKNIIRMTTWRK